MSLIVLFSERLLLGESAIFVTRGLSSRPSRRVTHVANNSPAMKRFSPYSKACSLAKSDRARRYTAVRAMPNRRGSFRGVVASDCNSASCTR
eukprot:5152308-Pyramimonas_sp.AAC.1